MKFSSRFLMALLIAVVAASLLAVAALGSTVALANATSSGLFGICGPYGSDWSINLQFLLIAVALLGAPACGVVVFAIVNRRRTATGAP